MAKPNQTAVYAEILKMDEQPDGSLLVHGKATDDTLDSDAQICDPTWLKSAMPEWFRWGNIREQHSSIAAGVATEYKSEGTEHFITAHVVDPGSVAKVKAGVLKGFSIGIRGARVAKDNKAAGGRIVDGTIVEISLVDRPANPACTLTMAKTVKGELTQVEELAENGSEVMEEMAIETPVTASALIESAKTIAGEVTKFDQASFDMARIGLARLLQVEAMEMEMGSDETDSIACLFAAIHALFEFHQDEAAEGEAMQIEGGYGDTDVDSNLEIELADEPETVKDGAVEMCKECGKAEADCACGDCKDCGMAMKECKCAEGGYSAEMKSDEPEEVAVAEVTETDEEKAIKKAAKKEQKNSELREMIAEVVKSLLPTETVGEEITKSIDTKRIEVLESELEQVKSLAVPSGPKRMNTVSNTPINSDLAKAATYRAKAAATEDLTLRKGYLDVARDLENK